MVTDVGRDLLMNVAVALGTSAPAAYYVGLIGSSSFVGLSAGDTMSSHAGWSEETAYSQSTRPTWTDGGVSGGLVTNPAFAEFTLTADKTIKGAFLATNSTKGGTTGTLVAVELLIGGDRDVLNGETLKVKFDLLGVAQ